MKYIKTILISALAQLLFLGLATAQDKAADMIVGNWQPSDGRSVITIYKGIAENGDDPNKYYGKIVWLIEPNGDDGKPKIDLNNPKPELRDRTIKGLVNLKDLEFTGNAKNREWDNGKIYDPNNGSTYSFYVEMPKKSDNFLEARGYIGVSMFGRTDTWKRLVQKK